MSLVITDCLLMLFSGSCAPAHLGETCPLTTVTGKTPIVGFAVGATREFGLDSRSRLIKEPDYEWLMIDASHIKVHPHASGAQGGNQDMGITKGG